MGAFFAYFSPIFILKIYIFLTLCKCACVGYVHTNVPMDSEEEAGVSCPRLMLGTELGSSRNCACSQSLSHCGDQNAVREPWGPCACSPATRSLMHHHAQPLPQCWGSELRSSSLYSKHFVYHKLCLLSDKMVHCISHSCNSKLLEFGLSRKNDYVNIGNTCSFKINLQNFSSSF